MRPIPRRLLPHSATLRTTTSIDNWQHAEYTETPLQYVRVEPSSRVVRGKDNSELQLAATLIYDCRNSTPQDVTFEAYDPGPGQSIVWRGREYRVESAELLHDARRPHHWEVGLA